MEPSSHKSASVIFCEHFEPLKTTVGKLNMFVHPAPSYQSRIEFLHVIGGKHDQPLSPTGRPESIYEIQ
ncbi:hypothetical protein QQP08_009812 [Theobroma cacao]|nr:hypothetical protein QQP08_009812 [Theobroma cacao]